MMINSQPSSVVTLVGSDPRFHVGGAPPEVVVSFGSGEVSPSLKATLDRLRVRIEIRSQGVLP